MENEIKEKFVVLETIYNGVNCKVEGAKDSIFARDELECRFQAPFLAKDDPDDVIFPRGTIIEVIIRKIGEIK